MKMKTMRKCISAILCASMLLATAGCGSTSNTNQQSSQPAKESSTAKTDQTDKTDTAAAEKQEIEEVSTYIMFSSKTADEVPWFDKYLQENVGIKLNGRVPGDQGREILQSMMASGELTDVVGITDDDLRKSLAESGLLLDLNQYKDQLPSVFENPVYATALQYNMDTYGDGEHLYYLPCRVGKSTAEQNNIGIRWDLFKKAGYPQATNADEYLDVLKKMQEIEPKTDDGADIYAFELWNSWDGTFMYNVQTFYGYPIAGWFMNGVRATNRDASEWQSLLADGGVYYEGLKFLYKANQMGLIDPDSASQAFDAVCAKEANGQALIVDHVYYGQQWKTYVNDKDNWKGYANYWNDFMYFPLKGETPNGHGWGYGVSANAENLEGALKYINWLYSYEGIQTFMQGPEGYIWERDASGNRVYTEAAKAVDNAYTDYQFPEGGTLLEANQTQTIAEVIIEASDVNPETGEILSIFKDPEQQELAHNPVLDDWYTVNGEYSCMYQRDGDKMEREPSMSLPPISDEMLTIESSIGSILKENSWKMVFAKDEAEFEALWEQTKKEAKALGLDELNAAYEEQFQNRTVY